MVRWHYQWIVVHEFLPKIVGRSTADGAMASLQHFSFDGEPFIPVEFSGAAYRFGHSMARSRYALRHGAATAAKPLFPDLSGLRRLDPALVLDWGRFFELDGEPGPQDSHRIDTTIANPLFDLPDGEKELAKRNLQRGRRLGLPSGQAVAEAMDLPALEEADLGLDPPELDGLREQLRESTPLWYYILCEAAKPGECDGQPMPGAHLGPVGGRIVAEVLVGLLVGDPTSYLSKEPDWTPTLGEDDDFTMADLIGFVRS
jgi:Animal haem peroxidase